MIGSLTGAAARAIFAALLVATPSLILPSASGANEIVALIALGAAAITFCEYFSHSPCLIEFRDAPPFNRIRFLSLFVTLFVLAVMFAGEGDGSTLSLLIRAVGLAAGTALDFPFSPVRLVVAGVPEEAGMSLALSIRAAAGLAYAISIVAIVFFVLILRLQRWPSRAGAFNVWINLPTFDPTTGNDIVARLNRDARINVALGFLLPFLIPSAAGGITALFGLRALSEPHSVVWLVSTWSFLPLSLFMRGIAMGRVASMIAEKRRRTERDAPVSAGLALS
ncbi:hypothetical protein RM543_05180 [Roseicyclus sp. F158]|uniref:Uncharacterized protein n=1 Tax=Tropicimonas omnivorans TaxID=3075590 RepID=A0ABU3DEC2_9RHOB|nr:hypothetical protein [Roseicyclus sp. F158]MDT0682068.1 hypothetical protein [Roseicyclus sp. F158]